MILKIVEEHLRKQHGLPEDFHFFRWACFPQGIGMDQPVLYYELEGGRCPLLTRGENRGSPNWRKLWEKRKFVVKTEEADAWADAWERQTGKCARCHGSGQVTKSVNREGVVYRACPDCSGTGLSQNATG